MVRHRYPSAEGKRARGVTLKVSEKSGVSAYGVAPREPESMNLERESILQVSANGSVRGVRLGPRVISIALKNAALGGPDRRFPKPLEQVIGVRIPASQPIPSRS